MANEHRKEATREQFLELCTNSAMHGIMKAIQFYNKPDSDTYKYFRDNVPHYVSDKACKKFWTKYHNYKFN